MNIVHLLASPFLGGPERQVLGLARALPPSCRTTFLSFAERGLARPFLRQAQEEGFEAVELKENFPHLGRAIAEVAYHLRRVQADVLCCACYKPDLIGWRAARRAGIPVVAIAHGWTSATWKVRLYETLDALVMRWLDRTVCVSEAMAARVRQRGIAEHQIVVIRNALDPTPFDRPDSQCRQVLLDFFPRPPALIVGAAGRLSPEKGFDIFLEAAARVAPRCQEVGFLVFGDGPLREYLRNRIHELSMEQRFILGGFRTDLDRLWPGFDLAVLSSYTEGLPVAVLEAQAAGVPVVATAVGGTPEVVEEGETGFLVPAGQPDALAERILEALADKSLRSRMGAKGRERIRQEFSFAAQAEKYLDLFNHLTRQQDFCLET